MQTNFDIIPIDRTTISTRLRIHPDLLDNPNEYIRKHTLPIRTAKATKGTCARGSTRNLTLKVLTYGAIEVKLRKVAGELLTNVTIRFNACKCLRNHNGSVLRLAEFIDAVAILVTHLKPLLKDPEDWIDLIPGLRSGGLAYWSSLEIFLHCSDPDGTLLAGFRNAQRKSTQTKIRHWPESMVIGGKRSDLQFGIYRKAVEMVAHDKLLPEQQVEFNDILRLEVRLKGKNLVQYLGNERNVEEIDGKPRLVRFYPLDAVSGCRTAFGELQGVFHSNEPLGTLKPKDQLIPLGRLLARVSLDPRTAHTLQELLLHIRFYTGAKSKSEMETIGKIRKAGIEELERLSTIAKEELFTDEAYIRQPSIWSEEREEKVLHEVEDAVVHPLIYKAYRPPNQPMRSIVQWPEYIRG